MVAQGKAIDRIPPTQDALLQHAKRAAYQAGCIWAASFMRAPENEDLEDWGWKIVDERVKPHWTDLSAISDQSRDLIKCGCTKGCKSRCKCRIDSLPCTELCACHGDCTEQVDEGNAAECAEIGIE